MLVLTRKEGERILIGKNISVQVVRLETGGVRIGIEAPREVEILREEIANRYRWSPSRMEPSVN
ncbi:Carbon storage regulator [Planctomycetes bacterium Pan216]|uniref:Translational regulator CsrA n=1 Tax=Kolteria novifilia TaxID=2527975 RepID=A0A518B3I5_9BACT|nr:Carbon storage regulator [Planctomycetes bacterium Pan216]